MMSSMEQRDKTLALAGVFQAAELVNQAATSGVWSGYAAEQSVESLFTLDSNNVNDIYSGAFGVKLGLKTLSQFLGGSVENNQPLKYVVSLLQLEPRFSHNSEVTEAVARGLGFIVREHDDESPDYLEQRVMSVADLYQNTVSTVKPRIMVTGKMVYLEQERTINWIRALLFAGLRSAVLWRQLGGSRWTLLFGRKKLLVAAEQLLSA